MNNYEWLCETVKGARHEADSDTEITNHSHAATYAEVLTYAQPDGMDHCRIALVLIHDDMTAWAYMEDGHLPTHFADAYGIPRTVVPKRFHAEVSKATP